MLPSGPVVHHTTAGAEDTGSGEVERGRKGRERGKQREGESGSKCVNVHYKTSTSMV